METLALASQSTEFTKDIYTEALKRLSPDHAQILSVFASRNVDYESNPYFSVFSPSLGMMIGSILFQTGAHIDTICDRPKVMNAIQPVELRTVITNMSILEVPVPAILDVVDDFIRTEPNMAYRTRMAQALEAVQTEAIKAMADQYALRDRTYSYNQAIATKEGAIWPIMRMTYLLTEGPQHNNALMQCARLINRTQIFIDDIKDFHEDNRDTCINTLIGRQHDFMRKGFSEETSLGMATLSLQKKIFEANAHIALLHPALYINKKINIFAQRT